MPYAFTTSNPVAVGSDTEKPHYDAVFDNTQVLREGGIAMASQAALDFIYAASASMFARLAKGTALQKIRINAAANAYEFGGGGKQELYLPAAAWSPHATGGCGSIEDITTAGSRYYRGLPFDPTTAEYAACTLALPKQWALGTITAQFYWLNKAGGSTNGVVWTLAGLAMSDGETADAAPGTLQQIADAATTAYYISISGETPAITIGGTPAVNDFIRFVVGRLPTDGGDTYASDAYLLGVKLRLTTTADTDD